ncbi:MAG: sigma-70 family RNA polymerase sigma factor [Deltaproteobacteria bacterium]|nr:sigma-70 family RNA polymerase sigma factor [Deltaproteobacteria bacterium]
MDEHGMLEGLCQRDSNCLKLFWDRYWSGVYAICARILGKNTDATDLAVDLLTEFIDIRVQNVEKAAAMGGYLRLMAVRRALDLRKKRSRMSELGDEIWDTGSASPEEMAAIATLMPRLENCLPKLSEKAQQTLRLKYVEQWSNEHIGSIVGGSRQYIGRLIQQSLELLRTCVEKDTHELIVER